MKLTAFLFAVLPLFGGQSLLMTGGSAATTGYSAFSRNLPYRTEFYLHGWSTSGVTLDIGNADAFGLRALLYNPGTPDNLQLALYNTWETDPVGLCQVQIGTANGGAGLPTLGIYVRYQH